VARRLGAALDGIRGEGWRDEIESLDPAETPGVLTIATADALMTDGDSPRAIDIARRDRQLIACGVN
jgi:hypothetical protein